MTDKPSQNPPHPPIPPPPGLAGEGDRGSQPPGGLASRTVEPIRHAIPTALEGDALFENLFDEVTGEAIVGPGQPLPAAPDGPAPRLAPPPPPFPGPLPGAAPVPPGREPTLGEAASGSFGATPPPGSVMDVDDADVELVDPPGRRPAPGPAPAPGYPPPPGPPPGFSPGVGRPGVPGYLPAPVPPPRPLAPTPGGPRPFGPVGGLRPNLPVRPPTPYVPPGAAPPPPQRGAYPPIPAPPGVQVPGYPPAQPPAPVTPSEPPEEEDEATRLFDSSRGPMAAILAQARAERASQRGEGFGAVDAEEPEVADDLQPIAYGETEDADPQSATPTPVDPFAPAPAGQFADPTAGATDADLGDAPTGEGLDDDGEFEFDAPEVVTAQEDEPTAAEELFEAEPVQEQAAGDWPVVPETSPAEVSLPMEEHRSGADADEPVAAVTDAEADWGSGEDAAIAVDGQAEAGELSAPDQEPLGLSEEEAFALSEEEALALREDEEAALGEAEAIALSDEEADFGQEGAAALFSDEDAVALSEEEAAALTEEEASLTEEEHAAIAAQDFGVAEVDVEQAADAVVTLVQTGERDAWFHRAEWLYDEAPARESAAERAAALVVVAEQFAMCGEEARAEEVAREALELAPSCPIARRQLRGLLAARSDWPEVLELLDVETKLGPTAEAKVHAAQLGSIVARLGTGDPDEANRRLKLLQQLEPNDVRPGLFQLAYGLSGTDEVPKIEWPAEADVEPLVAAGKVLTALRSNGTESVDVSSPLVETLKTRAALRRRDVPAAVEGLTALAGLPGLEAGSWWLLAALAAPHDALRPRAVDALSRVGEGSHGAIALKTRALRALEAGDTTAAMQIANTAGEDVLGAADRLVLAGLTATPLDRLGAWLQAADEVEDYAPLACAAAAALTDPRDGERQLTSVGAPADRAAALLGRQLAAQAMLLAGDSSMRDTTDARLRDAAQSLADADPTHGVARAVLAELAHGAGEVARLVELLMQDRPASGPLEREQSLAAALFAEISGNRERFHLELEKVRQSMPGDALSLRMRLQQVDAIGAAHELVRFAEHAGDATSAALALTEAALLYSGEGRSAESEPLLRRAAEIAPDFPLPASVGWIESHRLGNAESELEWLRLRHDRTAEPADRVFDLIRMAWRLEGADDELERARLIAEAHQARPADTTLRDVAERWAPDAIPSRAQWLMERVAEGQPDAAPLALEAALRFESDGDWGQAAGAAALAAQLGDTTFAPLFEQRYALQGTGADAAVAKLAAQYEAAEDPTARRELGELLARIELDGRHEPERAVGWLRAALDNEPTSLPTLSRLERLLATVDQRELLGTVGINLARLLDGPEGLAHAMLAARLLEHGGRWQETSELVELAQRVQPANLWTLRQTVAHAKARGDHETLRAAHVELVDRTGDPMEQATLLLRAAESSEALGDHDVALDQLDRALELWPDHYVARLERAKLLERSGDTTEAAASYEQLANVSQDPTQRAESLHYAATLWLSLDGESARDEGRRLLEAVMLIEPTHLDAFERLRTIYAATGAKTELADLLDTRLQTITDPQARADMEVMRGKILAEAGASAEARAALEAAIAAYPNNQEALLAYADVCAAEQDWPAVEQALIDLGRLASEAEQQVAVYLRLGELYGVHVPNPERAELAYTEVLSLDPNNSEARMRLVDLYLALGDTTRAFEQQAALIDAAEAPKDQCERVVRMAEIYDVAGDQKQAEATLVKARRTFPREPAALMALCDYYRAHGQEETAAKTLTRSAAEVRRALSAGRFEADLFAMLASIGEMSGDSATAEIAQAALAALEGRHTSVAGIGAAAGADELDALLAPDIFTEGFRRLLRSSGALLELGEPFDLASVRARPFGDAQAALGAHTLELAKAYGIGELQLLQSAAVGPTCVPVGSDPPQLVFGTALIEEEDGDARDFLIHRALKLVQTCTATLARTAPIDLWPLVAAYLKLHSPSFNPQGVDARRLTQYHQRMAQHARAPDPKVSLLAAEVISAIGNRASSLNAMASAWGSRAALLAIGDPFVALIAVAWASGTPQGPPPDGEERLKWVARKAEARDIIVFLLSEEYAKARAATRG